MHCDPAPPHPDPGQVYNAVCWPGGDPVAQLTAAAAFIGIGVVIYWVTRRYGGTDAAD